jgi:hypothetical protein
MSSADSPRRWTAERQLRFLDALADTRSVRKAAAAAGMSREGAHRLRNRPTAALFAAVWDRVMQPDFLANAQGHNGRLTDGQLARLLGNDFRRERGDFAAIGAPASESRAG